jgi:hypothetical protein
MDTVDMDISDSDDLLGAGGEFYTEPQEQTNQIQGFYSYDSNGDGVIEQEEFQTVLSDAGCSTSSMSSTPTPAATTLVCESQWKSNLIVAAGCTAVFLAIGLTMRCVPQRAEKKRTSSQEDLDLKSIPTSPMQSPDTEHRGLVPPTSPATSYQQASLSSPPPLPLAPMPTARPLPTPPRQPFQSPVNVMRGLHGHEQI